MGMPQVADRWTPELVRALPDDGRRYEVVAGRPEVLTESLSWQPEPGVEPVLVDLTALFAQVLDEA
jgi:hypothetical protein